MVLHGILTLKEILYSLSSRSVNILKMCNEFISGCICDVQWIHKRLCNKITLTRGGSKIHWIHQSDPTMIGGRELTRKPRIKRKRKWKQTESLQNETKETAATITSTEIIRTKKRRTTNNQENAELRPRTTTRSNTNADESPLIA